MISGKLQNSGKFENNAINDVKQISMSHVVTFVIYIRTIGGVIKEICEIRR